MPLGIITLIVNISMAVGVVTLSIAIVSIKTHDDIQHDNIQHIRHSASMTVVSIATAIRNDIVYKTS